MERTFKISHELFQGYTIRLKIKREQSPEELANAVKNNLIEVLRQLNLEMLINKVEFVTFHIYEPINQIHSCPDKIIWVCSHPH